MAAIDSPHIKAHRCAGGGKKGRLLNETIGISRGGRNTKPHTVNDMKCRPLALFISPGQRADINGTVALAGVLPPVKYMIADKAYNFARRLKTLKGLTPYEYINIWTKEPKRFNGDPFQHTVGLNT